MAAHLIITADDFGYHPRYDAGILEAVEARAIDAVSVMVLRAGSLPAALTDSGLALGLHLEPGAPGTQLEQFEALAGRPADYLDGHRHCHATALVMALAAERDLPVRSIHAEHRRALREAGVRTPDRLIGRYEEGDPVRPPELEPPVPQGWTEWMVHPGHAAGAGFSSYDAGREEDLRALLGMKLPEGVSRSDQRSLPPPP